jgi:hypothetical protein
MTIFSHLRSALFSLLVLAAAAPQPVRAQQASSVLPQLRTISPTDPEYAARKRRLVRPAAMAATMARPAATTAGTPAQVLALPACFEIMDTTATGGWTEVLREDDTSSPAIPLGFNFSLFGTVYNTVWVNVNGNITFTGPLSTFTAIGFPANIPMIAPFWGDADASLADSSIITTGNVWYKVFPDRLVVTWNRIGYFDKHHDKKNTFQLTLRNNTAPGFAGDDVLFAYGDMQWTTGDASNGINGFGGDPATVGVNRGNSIDYIQIGRFNLDDATHPNNQDPSGVHWLDNQCISMQVGNTGNVPPSVTSFPAGNSIDVILGQTVTITPQFIGPEVGQNVTVTTNTGGLCNTTISNNGTPNPTVTMSVTGAACNLGAHTVTFTATDDGTPAASQTFTLTVNVLAPTFNWTGAVSTVYTTPGNWSSNTVPGSGDHATIPTVLAVPGNWPVLGISGGIGLGELTIQSGAHLTIGPNAVLNLSGDLHNDGQVLGTGTFRTSGALPQILSGAGNIIIDNVSIGAGSTTFQQPVFVDRMLSTSSNLITNNHLTLRAKSNGTGTAMVVNDLAGVVSGTVTVQQFVGPTTGTARGYRHLAAPVTNTTIADLAVGSFTPTVNTAYNTAPNPGTVTPFPTIYTYDQTRVSGANTLADFDKGWLSPAAANSAMTAGAGYTVNMPGNQLIDFVGTLGNGTITRSGLGRGTGPQAGWHLLGNPYPSPISWTSLFASTTGLDNAVYAFKSSGQYTGSYAGFVNGIGVNGGSAILPLGQAFFVRTSLPGSPGSVTFSNAARLTTYTSPLLQRGTNDTRPLLRLDLSTANGTTDQAVIYFEQGASAAFDRAFDAYRLGNDNPVQLGILAGSEELSINGLPVLGATAVTVPLVFHVAQSGSYTLAANQLLNLPQGWTATLCDAVTGARINLRQQPTYACTLTRNQNPTRFTVLLTPTEALATTPANISAQVTLYPNPAHERVTISLPATSQVVAVSLLNGLGQEVRRQQVAAGRAGLNADLSLAGLAKGVYTLRISLPEGVVAKRLVVE